MSRRGAESDNPTARRTATAAGAFLGLVFCGVGLGVATLAGISGGWRIPVALVFGFIAGVAVRSLALSIAAGAARGVGAFIYPTGASAPYEATFSAHDAMEAAGNVTGAIEAYEAALLADPTHARALRQAAELHVRAGNATRAAELFATLRRVSDSREAELYATQRLVDLYMGSLGDDGRAMVELRRLVDRFPGTPEGAGALVALRRLRAGHAPGDGSA